MLWQHDQREPIGVWRDIFEDDRGLFVRGQLILDGDPVAQRAYGKLKHGALGGLSIGYTIPKGGAAPDPYKAGVLRLKKIDLREISLVTMPMNTEAKVTAVKTVTDGQILPSLPDFENFLREAGFSKSQATAIAGKGLKSLLRSESGSENTTDFLSALAAQIRG
jgi:HK97 family phage prohead protease